MRNVKTFFELSFLCIFGLLIFLALKPNSVSADSFGVTTEESFSYQEEEWGNELEYIFTYLYSENEAGVYIANEENLQNSAYTVEEKASISRFVNYLNSEIGYPIMMRSSSWFERCLAETYGITKPSIDAIVKDVRKKDFWAAGSKLATAIAAGKLAAKFPRITAAIAVGYLAFCGSNSVS